MTSLLSRLKSKLEYGNGNKLKDSQVPIPAITAGEIREIVEELERLEERLEINHWYDADGNEVPMSEEDKEAYDGIFCRDEKIKLMRSCYDRLRSENEKLRELLQKSKIWVEDGGSRSSSELSYEIGVALSQTEETGT